MHKILALILAGGKGTRMDILCHHRPKPTLPFAGQYRVIDITLSNCLHSQIDHLAALVDYQRSAMIDYLNQWRLSNSLTSRLSILPPEFNSYNGTADAVYQNLDFLKYSDIENVLILAGDHIYKMDYRKMVDFHKASQADVTVGLVQVPFKEAQRFGTVITDSNGRIRDFIEKSSTPVSNLASMGIYVFNRQFLIQRLLEDARDHNSPHDFGYAILPRAVKHDRVFGYKFAGYWQDIGTVEAFYEANMQLLRSNSAFKIDDLWTISTVESNTLPFKSSSQEKAVNSLISPGCVIDGYVENSILSPGVWVEKKARVINSIVMANTRIGYHSVVDRCILDEAVNIDRFCYLGFGAASVAKASDLTLVGKYVNLGPQIAIGRKAKIMPGLRIADLKSQFVAPGTVVSVPA